MSWINGYIGGVWTEENDCFWWFRRIQKDTFNIDVLSCKSLSEKRTEIRKWYAVDAPSVGDAVWMSKANEPHHIGVFTGFGVLHAVEFQGVIHESIQQIRLMGWKIVRFDRHG